VTFTDSALFWLHIGESASPAQVQAFSVLVEGNGGSVVLALTDAARPGFSRWEGTLEITSELGRREVSLSYAETPEGRWAGKMFYFASFGDDYLQQWIDEGLANSPTVGLIPNAFVQRWAAFKFGRLPGGLDELRALLTSMQTGSWNWASVRGVCEAQYPTGSCYPYSNGAGFGVFTEDGDTSPVPTGLVELPMAVNLKPVGAADRTMYTGKIVSADALHYAGDPEVQLRFEADPSTPCPPASTSCISGIQSFGAVVNVGGRYLSDEGCAPGFDEVATPWLLPGFAANTVLDGASGLLYRHECRDRRQPYGDNADFVAVNAALASANPVPDGRTRSRTLELIDGALINQDTLFVLFRERFESFIAGGSFSAYGYLMLQRAPASLDAAAYVGTPMSEPEPPPSVAGLRCEQGLLDFALGDGGTLDSPQNVARTVAVLLTGVDPAGSPAPIAPGDAEKVHYLCGSLNNDVPWSFFDGGTGTVASSNADACPAGSNVRFFSLNGVSDAALALESCNKTGTCQATLEVWRANQTNGLRLDPVWRCADANAVYCDANRLNLRAGKTFYRASQTTPVMTPLLAEIDNAFRYKTRFRGRAGTSLGFAPAVCVDDSDAVPYCYDPGAIEDIEARVDCLVNIFTDDSLYGLLSADQTTLASLELYLRRSFATVTGVDPAQGTPLSWDGFERLFAELLIMLGDDAYTAAFASRFDLAGSAAYGFQGSLFEPDGIDLSGAAGYEMFELYRAAQYYQLVLDRFYRLSEAIELSATRGGARNFITQGTFTSYFDRLARASTQKARVHSEIAKRYQSFNRPDLARLVVERAYTATYLESVIFARMLKQYVKVLPAQQRPQIDTQIELAQLGYRSALLQMREVYADITDDLSFFGYAADYVPFPPLDPGDTNAFHKLLGSARQKLAVAADKERLALESDRSYEVDAVAFQNELTRIRTSYENELADICGTFTVSGRVYPAIGKYAYLDEKAKVLQDPCGLMGSGAFYRAMVEGELALLDLKSIVQAHQRILAEVQILEDQVEAQCGEYYKLDNYRWNTALGVSSARERIRQSEDVIENMNRHADFVQTLAAMTKCSAGTSTDCPTAAVATLMVLAEKALATVVVETAQMGIASAERDIEDLQRQQASFETLQQCDFARIDANATIKTRMLGMMELELDALKADYRIRIAMAEVERLRAKAQKLVSDQKETEQLTINLEAARNDPNVRIYKNDAIIAADRTFLDASREAYKATKVYEYYTSQSYARLDELFLVRMVAYGDTSLESYVSELGDAYDEFAEQYGNPDVRVAIVSLRDDVMGIPRIGADGVALSQQERVSRFRERLADVTLLDSRGYITLPFSTSVDRLSPLTRNHKVSTIEAEIIGSDVGDTLGRVYLRQRGTGTVRSVSDDKWYYVFPERTAVVDAFFNGQRVFTPDVYRTERLRDRPLVNTRWELVLNQRDEYVNMDIDLQSLTDVRLYVYYTDLTVF
ncbi:MAG: hypothetical protein AAB426_12860, partial [Myxococcota bacterium]